MKICHSMLLRKLLRGVNAHSVIDLYRFGPSSREALSAVT